MQIQGSRSEARLEGKRDSETAQRRNWGIKKEKKRKKKVPGTSSAKKKKQFE